MLRKIIPAFAILVIFTGAASAQSFPLGQRGASKEQIQKENAEESAAHEAIEKLPDKATKSSDPWGNVRSAPQASDDHKKKKR
jgi:hypothetical protein